MQRLTDNCPMMFGKHKDKPMEEVPDDYLLWLWDKNQDKCFNGNLIHAPTLRVMVYIEDNLDAIQSNLNQ